MLIIFSICVVGCVYSMIAQDRLDKWISPPYTPTTPFKWIQIPYQDVGGEAGMIDKKIIDPGKPITQDEVDEFRRLLEKAKKYDADNGEKDCELDDKKEALRKLAGRWGLEINFP